MASTPARWGRPAWFLLGVVAACGRTDPATPEVEVAADPAVDATPPAPEPSAAPTVAEPAPVPVIPALPRKRGIAIPERIEDVERLADEGIRIGSARLVTSAQELAWEIGSDRTVVLAPGDYALDKLPAGAEDGAVNRQYIQTIANLTLVGLGDPPPRILASDENDVVASFYRTDGLQLYNLTFGHTTGQGCSAGVVRIELSRQVRLVGLDVFGSGAHGITLGQVDDAEIRDSRIHDCTVALDVIVHSKNVRYVRTVFEDQAGIVLGLRVQASQVSFDDVVFRKNRVDPTAGAAALFVTLGDSDPLDGLDDPERGAFRGPTKIVLRGSTVVDNRFDRLADDPTVLKLEDTPIAEGQFRIAAHAGTPEWWCACARRRDGHDRTTCTKTKKQCAKLEQTIAAGGDGNLAGGVIRPCMTAWGEAPGNDLGGSAWTRGAGKSKPWLHDGCFFDARAAIAAARSGSPTADAPKPSVVAWETLRPILRAHTGKSLAIDVPDDSRSFASLTRKLERAKLDRLPAGDPRMPAQIVALGTPTVVTTVGPVTIEPLVALAWQESQLGSGWVALFPAIEREGPMLATKVMPDGAAKIRAAPAAARIAQNEAVVASFLQALPAGSFDEVVAAAFGKGYQAQRMPGSFPDGAIEVVSINGGRDPESSYCGVFTVDAAGRLVQSLSSPGWGTCTVDFLVDLDGDGLDEVGWSSFGTEDESRMFSRLLATSIETISLFESGL